MEKSSKASHTSRRNFLKALGVSAALLFMGKEARTHLLEPIRLLNEDWDQAQKHTPESFLSENKEQLKNVRIGCSFSLEQMEYLEFSITPQDAVGFMKDKLGIQDVRLSFRSDRILSPDGSINFDYYDAYVQEFIRQGFQICWNIDGFKVSRYPEHHFSKNLIEGIKLPPQKTEVQLSDPLAQRILLYNKALYKAIQDKYDLKSRFAKGDTLQGMNEAFTCAGDYAIKASVEFLEANILALHQSFPEAKLLINSPGTPDSFMGRPTLIKVDDFIVNIYARYPELVGKLIAGFDWYGRTPTSFHPPGADRPLDMNAALQLTEGPEIMDQHRQKARKHKFSSQGTEIQWEPWGKHKTPGQSLAEFIFALTRSLKVCDTTKPTLLSLWGIENHLLTFANPTSEQLSMRRIIKQINKDSS